ncbi:MAG: hypothetical protein FJ403_01355 [Verrucomicrobia bacterium]|nr:hypothetical protein [Verrucomicrobiota bacterium]
MTGRQLILILSDIHYASKAEKQRGWREADFIDNPLLRFGVKAYRHLIWRKDPFAHNYLLDRFLERTGGADYVLANGDYSCDTAFIGLSDDASYESARECVTKLRQKAGAKLHLTIGDHELGKTSLFGGQGGMRLASWWRTRQQLGLSDFWTLEVGWYVLVGVTSSLLALPVYAPETLAEEREEWRQLRSGHIDQLDKTFAHLKPKQKVVLFCHDPTALPFLLRIQNVSSRVDRIQATVIGHLHSEFFMLNSRILSGMPTVHFLGTSIRRMSAALREARCWKQFHVRLCPALAGIQLLKDGGYLTLELDRDAAQPPQICRHRLAWDM